MKILIVTAHPSEKGRTHEIAKVYKEEKERNGDEVKVLNLYSMEKKIDNLTFSNIKELSLSPLHLEFQKEVSSADEIVVIHPIWWGLPPAIMKNWVDLTFWAKFAYSYDEKGNLKKLLIGKTAKVFATAGGPSWIYHLPFMPLYSFWKLSVFGFCGVKVTDFKVCGNIDKWKGQNKCEKHFQDFLKKVENSAK